MIIIDHFINYQEKGTSFVTVISGIVWNDSKQ